MGFWRFIDQQSLNGLTELVPAYDYTFSGIAALVAALSAFTLFPTLARVRSAHSMTSRRAWHFGGAITMGIGFWSAQNMALLGLELPASHSYQHLIGFAALLPGIAGCAAMIYALGARAPSSRRLHFGAASFALGVTVLHYVLVEAIHGEVVVAYDVRLFATALIFSYGSAWLALHLNRVLIGTGHYDWSRWLLGSLVLGIAVIASHYLAMAGTAFFHDPAVASAPVPTGLVYVIPLICGSVLFLVTAYWLGTLIGGRLVEAGEAVRSSEARHRAVVEAMMDAHLITDWQGVVRACNPAAEEVFGWKAGEIVGQSVTLLMKEIGPSGKRDWAVRGARARALASTRRRWVYPDGGRRKDGSKFSIEIAISPFAVDGEQFFSCVIRDLSDRWAFEARLRRLDAAIEQAGDAIALLGPDRRIEYVNPQYERQTGCARDEVIGRELPRSASDPGVDADLWATVDRGRTWTGTLKAISPDGNTHEEDVTVSPMRDDRGRVSGYVVVKRDTAVRRRLEAQARQKQKLDNIRHLADGIAHELNAPLQHFDDHLKLLQKSFRNLDQVLIDLSALGEGSAPVAPAAIRGCMQSADVDFLRREIAGALDDSGAAAGRVAGIVHAIREIAQPGAGAGDVDLNRIIQSTIIATTSEWQPVAEVRTDFDASLPHVKCMPGEIGLVLFNMLVQSAQAVAAANSTGLRGKGVISVSTARQNDWVEIRIGNTGNGVTPELRQKMFLRAAGDGAGTHGQDLTLAHDIVVRKHHGTISLESGPGRGATFIIRIPIEAAASAAATAAA